MKNKTFDVTLHDLPADKSISHRCAIFSLLSNKTSIIKNYLKAEDTINSLKIIAQLGAKVEFLNDCIKITPPEKIQETNEILDCGNSGTSMRILCGLLASSEGFFVLSGDKYLNSRPMKRIISPLRKIGAKIDSVKNAQLAPIAIRGKKLKSFSFHSKIPSAQIKTALILAALFANKKSEYKEDELSRNHTEIMLKKMGAKLNIKNNLIKITPLQKPLKPLDINVPNDPSSAFYFAVAAAIMPNSRVVLKNILLNETRIEAYKILAKMGVDVKFIKKNENYEKVGDIQITHDKLNAVEISENISWLIDEIPALSIALSCAKGKSVIKNAQELRVKESDRIKAVVSNLQNCEIDAKELEDGFEIIGGKFHDGEIKSFGDHRIAMSFLIANLKANIKIDDEECIKTSFPNFKNILKDIIGS